MDNNASRDHAPSDGGVSPSAHRLGPAGVSTDERIKQAAVALAVATVASCDCGAKSPDPEHHKAECTYASLRMAMARVDRIIARREAKALGTSTASPAEPAATPGRNP